MAMKTIHDTHLALATPSEQGYNPHRPTLLVPHHGGWSKLITWSHTHHKWPSPSPTQTFSAKRRLARWTSAGADGGWQGADGGWGSKYRWKPRWPQNKPLLENTTDSGLRVWEPQTVVSAAVMGGALTLQSLVWIIKAALTCVCGRRRRSLLQQHHQQQTSQKKENKRIIFKKESRSLSSALASVSCFLVVSVCCGFVLEFLSLQRFKFLWGYVFICSLCDDEMFEENSINVNVSCTVFFFPFFPFAMWF